MAKIKKTGRHTGAIKAHRQSAARARRNRAVKKGLRLAARGVLRAASAKNSAEVQKLLPKAYSLLDKAAKTGAIHWKAAARTKARLARRATAATAGAAS